MHFPAEWHATNREAQLAAAQLASGINALRCANHAQKGYYVQAFFGLSIGFERLAKLIIIADYAIKNNGNFPNNGYLKGFGHEIKTLLKKCNEISLERRGGEDYCEAPNSIISNNIIESVNQFGIISRYYNLDLLSGGRAAKMPEPIKFWWDKVGKPILLKHYSERQRKNNEALATQIDSLIGDQSIIIHHTENEEIMTDFGRLIPHEGETKIV